MCTTVYSSHKVSLVCEKLIVENKKKKKNEQGSNESRYILA